jgi:hypothetical protein
MSTTTKRRLWLWSGVGCLVIAAANVVFVLLNIVQGDGRSVFFLAFVFLWGIPGLFLLHLARRDSAHSNSEAT